MFHVFISICFGFRSAVGIFVVFILPIFIHRLLLFPVLKKRRSINISEINCNNKFSTSCKSSFKKVPFLMVLVQLTSDSSSGRASSPEASSSSDDSAKGKQRTMNASAAKCFHSVCSKTSPLSIEEKNRGVGGYLCLHFIQMQTDICISIQQSHLVMKTECTERGVI